MGEFGIGQPVPRTEDPRLLTGGGRYGDDFELPRQACGFILRSPHAHAEIRSIDCAAASAAPGVSLVLTGADWEESGYNDFPTMVQRNRRDGAPMHQALRKGLAVGKVRLVGDYVAFVVAETLNQAKDAAELIEVDYAILPSVTETALATATGAPVIWDQCPDNELFVFELGDRDAVEAAFARAHHVSRIDYVVNRISANAMEPRVSIGDYDRRNDRYTLHTATQGVHSVRNFVAHIMNLDQSQVRVIAGDVGGGFGMKGGSYQDQILVLWASRLIERPVRWTAERTESLMSDQHARDNVTSAELALDRDGKFLALRVRTIASVGAYLGMMGAHSPTNNLGTLAGTYTTPAIHVEVSGVFTNTNPTGPYRGAGRPEAALAIEKVIDAAARETGIDRIDLRRRNMIPPDAMPYATALVFTYDCGIFEENLDKALELADWSGFEARRAEAAARGRLRGIGISCTIEQAAAPLDETAEIRFNSAGDATIVMGTLSQGQGHDVTYKQIVNEHLGLPLESMTLLQGDTDVVVHGTGTFGSRSSGIGGAALQIAGERIIEKGRRIAAFMLETAETDIAFDDGTFSVAGTDRSVSLVEVARTAYNPMALPAEIEPTLTA
ncbi:MAG: xanthine dehydrogenase family protein molybdopterin-binding subunit, partial [Alphaproteobacteria bacterium]